MNPELQAVIPTARTLALALSSIPVRREIQRVSADIRIKRAMDRKNVIRVLRKRLSFSRRLVIDDISRHGDAMLSTSILRAGTES